MLSAEELLPAWYRATGKPTPATSTVNITTTRELPAKRKRKEKVTDGVNDVAAEAAVVDTAERTASLLTTTAEFVRLDDTLRTSTAMIDPKERKRRYPELAVVVLRHEEEVPRQGGSSVDLPLTSNSTAGGGKGYHHQQRGRASGSALKATPQLEQGTPLDLSVVLQQQQVTPISPANIVASAPQAPQQHIKLQHAALTTSVSKAAQNGAEVVVTPASPMLLL